MRVSFRERMEQLLCEHGMPRSQAQIVLECAIRSPNLKGLTLWDKDIHKYQSMMQARVWNCVRAETLAWLKRNWPDAPFRNRFESSVKWRGREM